MPLSGPDDQREADIFNDTRQLFHDLRGRLSVILSAAQLLSADDHGLSPDQAAQVARIDEMATALDAALTTVGNRLLDTLAFTPATRLIWTAHCLHGDKVKRTVLAARFTEMRTLYPLRAFTEVIVVAEPPALTRARTAFTRLGCNVRPATAPVDVGFLLDEAPCDVIAMQPPTDAEGQWWKQLRMLLQGMRDQPALMHRAPFAERASG